VLSSAAARLRHAPASACSAVSGSRLQLQEYINRFPQHLDAEIERLLPVKARPVGQHVKWLSPLDSVRYRISPSVDFLRAAGLSDQPSVLENRWSRLGPCWDRVGLFSHVRGGPQGVLLVEANSLLEEIEGSCCRVPASSIPVIMETLRETRQWLEALETQDWNGSLYRMANRLAHLHLLRNHLDVPAWLVQVYFLNDPAGPASRADWLPVIAAAQSRLGLCRRPPFSLDVFLPALNQR
jgi:hypothetical protein